MNLLEEISEHRSAKTLPLVAITVAVVPCPDTPVILTLHWHGFIEEKSPHSKQPSPWPIDRFRALRFRSTIDGAI